MLPLAHTGLTPPAVAGPGCNEWLGLTAMRLLEREFASAAYLRALTCGAVLLAGCRGPQRRRGCMGLRRT